MNIKIKYYYRLLVFSTMVAFCCCTANDKSAVRPNDKLLAKVYNKSLYLSQLDGMIPEGSSTEDSALILNAYIERWVRESLLMHEAERNISQDFNIDQLVRDYRASLIRHNYEKILLELELDSTISNSELLSFYESNKNQFLLESPLIRCHFVKIPQPVEEEKKVRQWWRNFNRADKIGLVEYCNQFASVHMLEDSNWYRVDDIVAELPAGMRNADNLYSRGGFIEENSEFVYLFRPLEVMKTGEIAPLSYIRDQAIRTILHKRKLQLLEEKKEEMYERELGKNNVKIY